MIKQPISQSSHDMTIKCGAFELPESPLLSEATRRALVAAEEELLTANALTKANPSKEEQREAFYQRQQYQRMRERYNVTIEGGRLGGVYEETFIPTDGILPHNEPRILINLHGGSFQSGSRTNSHMESVPVAALGSIKVISVDYRMAPEYQFPAATDDVVAVYQSLLNDYRPENIGIYGASSGAQLTAQTLVRLQENNLALPGAVGLIAEGATRMTGDSVSIGGALLKASHGMDLAAALESMHYFQAADLNSPQVTPALSDTFMAKFPPTLLASSTRDFMLSSVVATHAQLIGLGVTANLHIWEGLGHNFHYQPELPESEELHQVTVRFFDQYLGCCT